MRSASDTLAVMTHEKAPHEIIKELAVERRSWSDVEVLDEIERSPPLADEGITNWGVQSSWWDAANLYVALGDVAAERRLRPAVKLLLERASNGDPGEMMRGLRHGFEAIFSPDWTALADVCIELCGSERPGTRMWSAHQLMILDDPRARPVFERLLCDESTETRDFAAIGLKRLNRLKDA